MNEIEPYTFQGQNGHPWRCQAEFFQLMFCLPDFREFFFASAVPLGSPKSCVQCHIQWWCGSREFIARPPCLQKSVRRIAIFRWGTTWDKSLQPRYVAMLCVVLLSLPSHFTSIWLKERILFKISFFFGPSLKWASRFQRTGVFHGASKGCWRQRTERRGRGETVAKMIWIIRDIPVRWSENCKILLCPFWLLWQKGSGKWEKLEHPKLKLDMSWWFCCPGWRWPRNTSLAWRRDRCARGRQDVFFGPGKVITEASHLKPGGGWV